MKRTTLAVLTVLWMSLAVSAGTIPSSITYQGSLKQQGLPATGTKNMLFRITNVDGTQVYWSSTSTPVTVNNGLFSAHVSPIGVDWENVTPYIEVSVEGQLLLPREPVSSAPYALMCGSVTNEKGMIVMFAGSCPAGWARFAALDNAFPMGGSSYGATGGSTTHSHSVGSPSHTDAGFVFSTGQGSGSFFSDWGRADHVHTVSNASNLPPYITMVFCQKQ